MIFELSKNKSLHYLLSKVDLDEDTAKLVEENASASLIKMSLETNINSSNLIEYRKYIIKADEEDKEEQDRIRDEGELGSESLDDIEEKERRDSQTVNFGESSRDANMRAADKESRIGESSAKKKALVEAQRIKYMVDGMLKVLSSASLQKQDKGSRSKNKFKVVGGTRAFRSFAGKVATSLKAIEIIIEAQKPDYITNKFGKYITVNDKEGHKEFAGFTSKKDKDTKEIQERPALTKSINIDELTSNLTTLLDKKNTETQNNEPLILTLMSLLHIEQFGQSPPNLKNRKKYKEELNNIRRLAMGKSASKVGVGQKILDNVRGVEDVLSKLSYNLEQTYEQREVLNTAKQDVNKLVELKIKRLVTSYRTLVAEKNMNRENFKRMKDLLDEINQNPAAYEDEAREEIEKDIDIERRKLETHMQKIESITEFNEANKELKRIIMEYDNKISIEAVNKILNKILNAQVKLYQRYKTLSKLLDKNQDKIAIGVQSYLTDSEDSAQLELDADGLDYDGMATITNEFEEKVSKLTEAMSTFIKIITSETTKLKTLIYGEE